MSVTYRGEGYDAGTGTVIYAVPPTSYVSGDRLFLHIGIQGTATPTVSVDWTIIDSITGTNSIYVYTKVAGTEPVEYDITLSVSDTYVAMTTAWYSSTADPFSIITSAKQTNASSVTVTYPSVTTTLVNQVAFCLASYTTRSGFSMSPNGGFTERYEEGGLSGCVYSMSKTIAGIGATGTFTSSSTVSVGSKTMTVVLSDTIPGPTAPITLDATVTNDDSITVTWVDQSTDETYFQLQRSPDGTTWTTIATLAANTVSYVDSGLLPLTQYCYRVGAGNTSGVNYSNTDCGTTSGAPQLRYDIGVRISFDWDRDGIYTDEQAYVVSAKGTHRVSPSSQSITSSQGQVAQCTIVLDNTTGRFSSLNSVGALYSTIGEGKAYQVPVDVKISSVSSGVASNYISVFKGFARLPSESTLSPGQAKTITFDCRSHEDILMNKKLRTSQANFKLYRDNGVTESEFIQALVTEAAPSLTVAIDSGLVMLPWAYLENESVLETIWDICSATGGRFYGRSDGTLAYENAAHWLLTPHNSSVFSYTRGAGFRSLDLAWNDQEIAEEASVTWSEKVVGQTDVIYESDNLVVPAGATVTIWADFSSPAYQITSIDTTAGTNGGTNLSASIVVTPTYYAKSAKLIIVSSSSVQANVRIKINGKVAEDDVSQTVSNTSGNSFWTSRVGRSRKVSGNMWVQSKGQADMLLDFIRNRQVLPTLTAKMKGCPGIASRNLGDRITITDSEVYLSATDFFVTSISWTYGKTFTQDIEAVRCTDLYPHVDESPSYFIINTSELGAADPQRGRVFF